MKKMHADEVDIDSALVGRLLATQFPHWANLPVEPVQSAGTNNAIYRLGDGLAVRLPRIIGAIGQLDKEHLWLPRLAPRLPLAIPVPLAMGRSGEGYPWPWSVSRWLIGERRTMARQRVIWPSSSLRCNGSIPRAGRPSRHPHPRAACHLPHEMRPPVPPSPSFPA